MISTNSATLYFISSFLHMNIQNKLVKLKTKKYLEFIDMTDEVQEFVKQSGITNGTVLVYSKHTTVAVRINEKETGLLADFEDLMTRLIPKNVYYRHNDLNVRTENLVCEPGASDCLNAHSHCMQLLMGTSETVPVIQGKLVLGTWQRIFVIELDCSRNRQVLFQIMGE